MNDKTNHQDLVSIINADSTNTNSQRRLFVGALTGVAAAVWHKPVINAVILPSHAQTSATVEFFTGAGAVSPIAQSNSILESLISPAHAIAVQTESEYAVKVTQPSVGVNSYMIDIFERKLEGETNVGEIVYSGSAATGGSAKLNVSDNPCKLSDGSLAIELVSIDSNNAVINLTSRGGQIVVPSGAGSLPMPMCVDIGLPESFFDGEISDTIGDTGSIFDALIPEAHAGIIADEDRVMGVLATKIDEETYEVSHRNFGGNILRVGDVKVDGTVGQLSVVENACDDNANNKELSYSAEIIDVDNSMMMLNINIGKGSIRVSIPVGSGRLVTSCSPQFVNYTTQGLRVAKQNSLLGSLIPLAHAGQPDQVGALNAFEANAELNGSSFDVEIAAELQVPSDQQDLAGYNTAYVGTVSINGGSATLMGDGGCEFPATVSIASTDDPNVFDITVATDGGFLQRTLTPGNIGLPELTQCFLDD